MHSYLNPLHAAERALRNARTQSEHDQLKSGLLATVEGIRYRIGLEIETLQRELDRVLLIRGVHPVVFQVSALAAVMFGITFHVPDLFRSGLIQNLFGGEAIVAGSLALLSYGTLTATVSLGAAVTGRLPVILASISVA